MDNLDLFNLLFDMVLVMKPLIKNDFREVAKEVAKEGFDEKIEPFFNWAQSEFQEIKTDIGLLNVKFDKTFKKLDDFIFLYKKHDQEIIMLASDNRRIH